MTIADYSFGSGLNLPMSEFNPFERSNEPTFEVFADWEEEQTGPEATGGSILDSVRSYVPEQPRAVSPGMYCPRVGCVALKYLADFIEEKHNNPLKKRSKDRKKCRGFAFYDITKLNHPIATGFYKAIAICFRNTGPNMVVIEIEVVEKNDSQAFRLCLRKESADERIDKLTKYRFVLEPHERSNIEVYREEPEGVRPVSAVPGKRKSKPQTSSHFLTVKVIEVAEVDLKTSIFRTNVIAHKRDPFQFPGNFIGILADPYTLIPKNREFEKAGSFPRLNNSASIAGSRIDCLSG